MITARRNDGFDTTFEKSSGGVDLLERRIPENYDEYLGGTEKAEDPSEAKERMQKNLDRLLNYDRYAEEKAIETAMDETTVADEVAEETQIVAEATIETEDDIKPTSTTMQFGDNLDQIYNDMNKQKEEADGHYKLNGKGKLIVFLYGLAVSVILALIVLNTGVLASLSKSNATNAAVLSDKIAEYNAINEQIANISSDEYVLNIAENEFGMIER